MNDVNKRLQGKNICIVDLYFHLNECIALLPELIEEIKKGTFSRFHRCTHMILDGQYKPTDDELEVFARSASNVLVQCKKRFHELDTFKRLFETLSNPFDELNNFGDSALNMELIVLRCDPDNALLKSVHLPEGKLAFYPHIDSAKFPLLTRYAKQIISMFGTTYNCEASFSRLNLIKTEQRSRLSNECLTNLMSVDANYLPNFITHN